MVYYIEMNYRNYDVDKNKYKLEKVFIFSRHNVRSPLSDGDSILGNITNHSWFNWTSKSGELSLRAFDLEKEIGKYYSEYLIDKEFIDIKNSLPTISTSIANPILKEIYKELKNDNRKITFMCGHDVNISSILGALKVND